MERYLPSPLTMVAKRQAAVGLEAVAVDNDGLGAHGEGIEGAVHGEYAGVEYVQAVYLLGRHHAQGPSYGVGLDDAAQGVTPAGRELLGVVELVVVVVGRQDDRRCVHAAGKAAATGFVAAGFNEAGVEYGESMEVKN